MKLVYLVIILASLLIVTYYAKPVHADSADPVKILDVHVEPSMLKVNDTFSINATILNSSPYVIYLTSGSCTPAFSVSFDIHAKQVHQNLNCTTEAMLQKVDPDGKITISNANKPGTIYQAVLAGTSNASITIPYFAKNQTATDYSSIYYDTSKSFSFIILNQSGISQQHSYGGGGSTVSITLNPLQQIRAGTLAQNVKCSVNFNLIIKSEDGSPACVKPDTAKILSERGWTVTFATGIAMNTYTTPTNVTSPSTENLTVITPIVPQTNDVHGTIKDAMINTTLTELVSSSTGVQLARGGGFDSYDNDSIKLELYHGKISNSNVIAATVKNTGKRTVHVYGINISGFIPIANDITQNLIVIQDDSNIIPKEDSILEPGESQTKYIVGNWTVQGKLVNGFSAGTSYSYDDLQNYNGMTNGYTMSVPVQWLP